MVNEVVSRRDKMFSEYTHPELEGFIQNVIDRYKNELPDLKSQKIVRELFLYGFIRASGQEFFWNRNNQVIPIPRETEGGLGLFFTNNGILALSDFDGEIYIRGGESRLGYCPGLEEKPQGIEGTLLNSGYRSKNIYVPHSNGDVFVDEQREKLFQAINYFSRNVRNLRGESTSGVTIQDLSEPTPSAPYKSRNPNLPRIMMGDAFLIPGNKERTVRI